MTTGKSWHTELTKRLDAHARECFESWLGTKRGKRWASGRRTRSPYAAGFSLPDWHHRLIEALDTGDEETAKGIALHAHRGDI